MSLQRRLLLSLGLSFTLLWLVVAAILYLDLKRQIAETLDQRLAASATMVARLIGSQADLLDLPSARTLFVEPVSRGLACQIRSARGDVLLQSEGERGALLTRPEPGFSNSVSDEGEWRLFTLRHDDLLITTADRMSERVDLQNGIMLAMVVPFALALAGGLLVLWGGVRRGLAPLRRLREELARRRPDNLDPVRIGPAPGELQPVVATLNGLFARVATVLRREQQFASQAAHELRTPLTGIKTHLQVAERQVEGRPFEAVRRAGEGVARLQRVIEQLLMLARLDRPDQWPETSSGIREVTSAALADLADDGRLRHAVDDSPRALAVPGALAAAALRNLLDNALRHTPPGSPVELTVQVGPDEAQFAVRDRGHGDRFADGGTPDTERDSSGECGHGLGLAIVEAIVARFAGRLVMRARPDGGLEARLCFPLVAAAGAEPTPGASGD